MNTKFRLIVLSLILIMVSVLILPVFLETAKAEEKPLVAVLPFQEGDFSWKGFRGEEILNGITQMVTDRLVQIDAIRVIERSRIDEILQEQDFGMSGRVDPATAAEIGRLLGVDALIMGTLTQMDVGEKGGISIGPVSLTGVKAEVVITGRVVDATSGEIKDSFQSMGEATEASLSVSDIQGLSFGTNAFASSALGKSINKAVSGFVQNIIKNPEELLRSSREVLEGKVVKVLGDKLIINIGRNKNLKKKQQGRIIRVIEVEGLSDPVNMPIGIVEVFSVDESAAILQVIESEEKPQEGDIITFENL